MHLAGALFRLLWSYTKVNCYSLDSYIYRERESATKTVYPNSYLDYVSLFTISSLEGALPGYTDRMTTQNQHICSIADIHFFKNHDYNEAGSEAHLDVKDSHRFNQTCVINLCLDLYNKIAPFTVTTLKPTGHPHGRQKDNLSLDC